MSRHTRSYPPATRERARALRQQGLTYSEIVEALGGDIPKGTVAHWVRDVALTPDQHARIKEKERAAAAEGRQLAAQWHRAQKQQRLQDAETWAVPIAARLQHHEEALLLMMAALWLGDGSKKDDVLEFTNSDPQIIQGWLAALRGLFDIDEAKFSCQLLLNVGIDEQACLQFWQETTGITRFMKSSIDQRVGRTERAGYRGVCRVCYYSAELSRQLSALGRATLRHLTDT